MPILVDLLPDAKTLLALSPEELGDVILEWIHLEKKSSPGVFGVPEFLASVRSV